MKCEQGDYARIIYSVRPENIGKIVKVVTYIGKFNEHELFEFRSMPCKCLVTDHHWWIEGDDITIMFGPAPKAYIPDTWLEPIKPTKIKELAKEALEVDI